MSQRMPSADEPRFPKVATHLPESDIRAVANFLIRTEKDLSHGSHAREALIGEAVRRQPEIAADVRAEARKMQAVAFVSLADRLSLGVLPATIVLAALTAFKIVPMVAETPTGGGWFLVGLVTAVIIVGFGFSVTSSRRWLNRLIERRNAHLLYYRAVAESVGKILRQISFEWDSDEVLWGPLFASTHAPTLVGIGIENAISSETYQELHQFVKQHPTSAIGIAGPRGVGKSTLMAKLTNDRSLPSLGVVIPSPKRYEPAALVRLIHSAVANTILGRNSSDGGRQPFRRAPSHVTVRRVVSVALVFLLAVGLLVGWMLDQQDAAYAAADKGWRVSNVSIFLAMATSALIGAVLASAWRAAWIHFPGNRGPAFSPTRLARQQIDFLRFSMAGQTKTKGGWRGGGFRFEAEDQVSHTERDLTEAEQVDALRDFLFQLTARFGIRVIICIDELDKIDKPDDVVSIVNGVKDLFHQEGVHILVSVSTDAMHSFAARGVLVRDVFDSAFDTVIEVRRMGQLESRELLKGRVTSFSVPAMMFCHAWAGGHPRDLIRVARHCVKVRAGNQADLPLRSVVDSVVLSDTLEVVDAAIEKLRSDAEKEQDEVVRDLIAFRLLLAEDTASPVHEQIRAVTAAMELPRLAEANTEATALVNALAFYVDLAAVISRYFWQGRSFAEWQTEETAVAIQLLAEAQATLSRHSAEAEAKVDKAKALLS
ncbi:P-loop NTPase fold protein [Actinoplanes sp. NPDC000266]